MIVNNFISCSISTCPKSCYRVTDCLPNHGIVTSPDGGDMFWCQAPCFITELVSAEDWWSTKLSEIKKEKKNPTAQRHLRVGPFRTTSGPTCRCPSRYNIVHTSGPSSRWPGPPRLLPTSPERLAAPCPAPPAAAPPASRPEATAEHKAYPNPIAATYCSQSWSRALDIPPRAREALHL
jgi:hypothetical protein